MFTPLKHLHSTIYIIVGESQLGNQICLVVYDSYIEVSRMLTALSFHSRFRVPCLGYQLAKNYQETSMEPWSIPVAFATILLIDGIMFI